MKQLSLFILLCVAMFFASCSSQQFISTYSQKVLPNNDLMFRYYDSKTKIRYDFRNDDSLFYVILETDNKASQARIFRNGVKIFLSNLPKIDDKRFVQYPASSSGEESNMQNNENGEHRSHGGFKSHSLANISKLGLWNDNGKEQTFIVGIDRIGFDYFLDFDKDGFLHYEAKINLHQLKMNADTTTIVGVKIATLEVPSQGGGGGGMGGGGMNRGGGMGGGGMSRGGGRMTGMNGGGNYRSALEGADEKIDWWFKLKVK